jgi:branched-chain amino acid aminotransferase
MINYNGKYFENESAVLKNDDHSYRYGDGLFETLKVVEGNILYKEHHFERLFSGLKILKFSVPGLFTKENLEDQIKELCIKNKCDKLARVRLSVSRGGGGLYDCDNKLSYLIECWPIEQKAFNENGLIVDIFPDARKSIDSFSNLKSANYLPYIMGAVWAKENKLNEALILNSNERICDATIANVFWIKDDRIFTPPLTEGGVDGVMRQRILEIDRTIVQQPLTEDILLEADEVFLTNVITGIRWVGQFRNKKYSHKISAKLLSK